MVNVIIDSGALQFISQSKKKQIKFQHLVYKKASELSDCYMGGEWSYYNDNSCTFLFPEDGMYMVDGFSLSNMDFGLVATMKAMESFSVYKEYSHLNAFHLKLVDFSCDQPEPEAITSVLAAQGVLNSK